ncbi:MAG: twin-arginine translocase TatA/TatE family subunit [Humidesulfovibrio sp.]|uniref:twin-arginine translocase TatA/TatE family subunit n=1 Tax=Humidesulfovibrio sp. TaxID=2910988 RepID=UPI0027EF27ED|nr:twin-arginine translocase TatA/TatE family subunit [Humidesulfovibrio sp.]MDQ7835656.1 twin-arginine translocase TatA/TatE family subunit [Humidesulfovibrio sp.]
MFGTQEWLIIVIIGVVMFNWRKLPELGSSVGKALTSFKRGLNEPEEIDVSEKKKDSGETPPKP